MYGYHKRIPLVLTVLLTGALIAAGCFGEKPTPTAGIGLLDIQKLVAELELDAEFDARLQNKDQALSRELEERKQQYENLLRSRRERMGEEPTEEQQRELIRFETQAGQQLQAQLQESQRQLREYHQKLVRDLHQKLRPLAREVATRRGLDMVMLRSDLFFIVNEELDITGELIERLREDPDRLENLRPGSEDE